MDGNGRWAHHRGLARLEGHKAGTDNVQRILGVFEKHQIRFVTLFAFSTENWNRPNSEVAGIMQILQDVVEHETANLHRRNVRLRYLGRTDRLNTELRSTIQNALSLTEDNTGLNLSIALDYGGRYEIVQAVKRIIRDNISVSEITEQLFEQYLYTADLPDPDLVIRTGGEQRPSNFLTWQSVYSEYYYSETLWPDFDEIELDKVLIAYSKRKRRFGALDTVQQ